MGKEIWKDIKDYENLYQISNLGRVKSLKRTKQNHSKLQIVCEKILKNLSTTKNYKKVMLYKNKKNKNFEIHRLVAEAFLNKENFKSMPDEDRTKVDLSKLEINHKDENPMNNNVNNLEFCTHRYNSNYGTKVQRTNEKISKPVLQYDLNGNFIKEYESLNCIKRKNNMYVSTIQLCCTGKQKTAYGYTWKYKGE